MSFIKKNNTDLNLCIFQGKDFERTTLTTLQIGVKNKPALWVCKDKPTDAAGTIEDSVNVTITVIDVNDPPEFKNNPADVYQKEEEAPGKVLFIPVVVDVDSDESAIRLVSTYCMPDSLLFTNINV